MTRKRQKSWRRQLRKVVRGGTTRLLKPAPAAGGRLKPGTTPEALREAIQNLDNSGVLRLDRSTKLPAALAEASESGEDGQNGWLPSTLVISITLIAILFIGFITWLISQMPDK